MAGVLNLNDADGPKWFARQGARDPDPVADDHEAPPPGLRPVFRYPAPARFHLLVGCSVAKGSKMDSEGDDLVDYQVYSTIPEIPEADRITSPHTHTHTHTHPAKTAHGGRS